VLREKQKEEARLAEEGKLREMRLAAEQRQRELAEVKKRDAIAADERRTVQMVRRQAEAKETLKQVSRARAAHYLPVWDQSKNGFDYDAATRRGDAYARDTAGQYERERACVRDLNRCDY